MPPPVHVDGGLIPLHSEHGYILRMLPICDVEAAEPHLRIIRNRRGHVKRAYLKPDTSLDRRPDSGIGIAFEQELSTGLVWALRGTKGSK